METDDRGNEKDCPIVMIPYGRQLIEDDDIIAVAEVLRSDWLTTGPRINEFEEVFAQQVGAKYAVAVSSGTAALHAAMFAGGISLDDEVIVSSMTFAASANCIVFQGGKPVFADITPDTLLIDPKDAEKKITDKTKAIIAVDYTGHPCDYDTLKEIANRNNLLLVADACHSLGARYKGLPVGSLADLNVFSFHPVKHITTGEGGMITTNNEEYAGRMRIFRNHGIKMNDQRQKNAQDPWLYEMLELGYNYRITDFQCALGLNQLRKLPRWLERRRKIAIQYDQSFSGIEIIEPLSVKPDIEHAYHLYVVRVNKNEKGMDRAIFFKELRSRDIGVNVHYIPVHLHPFYRKRFGTVKGLCPVAENAYEQIFSLPMYPAMSDADVNVVIDTVKSIALL